MKLLFTENHLFVSSLSLKLLYLKFCDIEKAGLRMNLENFENSQYILLDIIKKVCHTFESFGDSISIDIYVRDNATKVNIVLHPIVADALYLLAEYNIKADREEAGQYIHETCLLIRGKTLLKKSLPLLKSQIKCSRHLWGLRNLSDTIQSASLLNEFLVKYLG
jgi:hypothetical protein